MIPTQDQFQDWTQQYFPEERTSNFARIRDSILPELVRDVVEWVTEEVAQEFDRKERAGAKGYGPSTPAKLVREFFTRSRKGPTLKAMSLLALQDLVPPELRDKSSYKLLETVLSNLPESPTNTL